MERNLNEEKIGSLLDYFFHRNDDLILSSRLNMRCPDPITEREKHIKFALDWFQSNSWRIDLTLNSNIVQKSLNDPPDPVDVEIWIEESGRTLFHFHKGTSFDVKTLYKITMVLDQIQMHIRDIIKS